MASTEKPRPAPAAPGWVQDHLTRYVETDGADGHMFNGAPTLLLTTTGRRSGNDVTQPLIYGTDGESYLVVASKGGAPDHPKWYTNLEAQPEVTVQVLGDRFAARARTATAEEKPRLWPIVAKVWPAYNDYQAKTSREIPVVVIERV